ncbi:hypothetical protein Q6D67_18190 [Haliea sp. E1-2-M8]|uniref:hypothetical protein n=1 Tax=Haliea sp. E1-2-M8 TaxID=3064706 RepID=UPI002717055A|nr:hypothetical protein [Haliea sp. E1-2-M8]MDO8863626.1 hypothetical protein [Haliea sp. E1-2-M8]
MEMENLRGMGACSFHECVQHALSRVDSSRIGVLSRARGQVNLPPPEREVRKQASDWNSVVGKAPGAVCGLLGIVGDDPCGDAQTAMPVKSNHDKPLVSACRGLMKSHLKSLT